jgi:ABC-type transport system substrate-binding protein
MTPTRRAPLAPLAAAALPWDITQAQAQTPATTLRVGMTAAAVPLSNGVPDQGAEGDRFMGITLYDQLAMWDLTKFDAPVDIRPGLATPWRVDPNNDKRWIITIRQGVKFHDGKTLTAEDVVISYDRALKNDAPHYDPRAAAQARIRMPTIAGWSAEGHDTFIIETRIYATFDPAAQTRLLGQLHSKVVDDALFLFVAHDLNPRAMSRRMQGFVQAQSRFQDLNPIRLQ